MQGSKRQKAYLVRVNEDEHKALAEAAARRGLSVSAFMRSRALAEAQRDKAKN